MSELITPSIVDSPFLDNKTIVDSLITSLDTAVVRNQDLLAEALMPLAHRLARGPLANLSPLLPLFFQYEGKPLTLQRHFPLETLFDAYVPQDILLLCSRQVGKTLQMVALTIMECILNSNWNTLYVAPLYEQVRRVSTDYFVELERDSPIRALMQNKDCVKQVLERGYPNNSRVRFTYANKSADRARGVHAKALKLDERQMMDAEVIPVLMATMLSSEYKPYVFSAATPLTNSNPTSILFREKSTRTHWMIPCRSCSKENIAAPEFDLLNMIGPVTPDTSPDRPGLKCADSTCGYYLYPQDGRPVHFNPEKREDFLGVHVPMTILPHHCFNYDRWKDLWVNLDDPRVPDYRKYNEWLGVPYDDGQVLLSEQDLRRRAVLNKNRLNEALEFLGTYNGRVAVGVDWGGGGFSGESLTKLAIVGLNANGTLDVRFGIQILGSASRTDEARVIFAICQRVHTQADSMIFAHDTASIGDATEEILINMGLPRKCIAPMSYVGETNGQLMTPKPPAPNRPKSWWTVDKARSLLHLAETIKTGNMRFFQCTENYNARELLLDFTHLAVEEKVYVHSMKSNTVLVNRQEGTSDDFAHAVNFARLALCERWKVWPKLSGQLTLKTMQELAGLLPTMTRALDRASIDALQTDKVFKYDS